jgi:5-methylcytosine-specific restriction protein B
MEFADKLLPYKNNRSKLLELIKGVFDNLGLRYPFMENGKPIDDICPFTVFGCFNKGITNDNRIMLMKGIGGLLGVKAEVPVEFDGIPVLNNMRAWFFSGKTYRKEDDISNLWDVFEAGINYADNPSEVSKSAFIACYDMVRKQLGIKWNLTMGLYWIRPFSYLNLDERNRSYLTQDGTLYYASIAKISNLKQLPGAKTYLELIAACKEIFEKSDSPHHSFPKLSHAAWMASTSEDQNKNSSAASFLKWFAPLINALRELGGSATPEQARKQIISDLNLPDEIINETRGKTAVKKFDNEVAFARNYLVYEGYIDSSVRGVWSLTEKGLSAPMNDEIEFLANCLC